jgi:hypothetical protein
VMYVQPLLPGELARRKGGTPCRGPVGLLGVAQEGVEGFGKHLNFTGDQGTFLATPYPPKSPLELPMILPYAKYFTFSEQVKRSGKYLTFYC